MASSSLPSQREIDLETLLRERETQIVELTSDITALRAYLPSSHANDSFESVTLNPALLSIIGPLFSRSAPSGTSTSTSATAALTGRVALLQQENDELYGLLKGSAVGKLKEEVVALRRAVSKLEGALKESHAIISNLSTELDTAYEALAPRGRASQASDHNMSGPAEPSNRLYNSPPPSQSSHNSHTQSSKSIPTGPRQQKKARLEPTNSTQDRPQDNGRGREFDRERERERDRERNRDYDYDHNRDREREPDRPPSFQNGHMSDRAASPRSNSHSNAEDHRKRPRSRSPPPGMNRPSDKRRQYDRRGGGGGTNYDSEGAQDRGLAKRLGL